MKITSVGEGFLSYAWDGYKVPVFQLVRAVVWLYMYGIYVNKWFNHYYYYFILLPL